MRWLGFQGKIFFIFISIMSIGHTFFARDIEVRSERKFSDKLMKHRLAVAMFYRDDKVIREDIQVGRLIDKIERIFDSLGKWGRYQDGDVIFLSVNVAKGNLDELADAYNITKLPAFLLFKNGVPLRDDQGKVIMWLPFLSEVTERALSTFIEKHLQADIDRNIRDRAEELRRRREAAAWWAYYYGPYYGPYWGYGPYYYGRPYGYVGFGIGF